MGGGGYNNNSSLFISRHDPPSPIVVGCHDVIYYAYT